MTRIQLIIEHEPDRRALEALLDGRYDVVVDEAVRTVDCYVVDDRTLPNYRERLESYKQTRHPTFVPAVLVERDDTRVSVELPDPDAGEGPPLVDEVVSAPVEKGVLFRRIDNLVVRREQSVQLTRQYEASKARFEGLFTAIPDPAFVTDDRGRLLDVNDGFCDRLGVERDEVLGRDLDAVEGIGLGAATRVVEGQTGGGPDQEPESTVQYTDCQGERRYATVTAASVRIEDDARRVGILTDITDLQEKTERLEEFASVMAHDLRNPLQVAKGESARLAADLDGKADRLAPVQRSLDRMEQLIDKLLRIARTGEDDVDRAEVALGDCATRAWETVDTREATLVTDVPEEFTVRADAERLVELFENLYRNAVEHGGEDVRIRVGTLADGFCIEDDGPGIPSEKRDDVFEMGYTTNPEGTGLGLNIVARIAEVHSWEMSATESSDGGARFEVTGVESAGPDRPS